MNFLPHLIVLIAGGIILCFIKKKILENAQPRINHNIHSYDYISCPLYRFRN